MAKRQSKTATKPQAESYLHSEATSPMRPEVGTQAQFKKQKPPQTYRYDSSLAPELNWDGQNAARQAGEAIIEDIGRRLTQINADLTQDDLNSISVDLRASAAESLALLDKLKRLGRPFLNWTGKAERLSFDVPTLPLFVHERLSTQAILQTLKGHKRDKFEQLSLFADPQHSITDQVLRAYEHRDRWTNRIVLGDSLVVMNSLVHYEGLGGAVQMIYMDPPYGVKFGSNFQPFVRRRDVKHNDDENLTREPEMVQAYRDTWELGLHSYLTYLRDRLLVARELLAPSGSLFVQISDENLHHVREVMDEVFGAENFVSMTGVRKTGGATSETLPTVVDFLLWYAKDRERIKYRQLFVKKVLGEEGTAEYTNVELADGTLRKAEREELSGLATLPPGARLFATDSAVSEGFRTNTSVPFTWSGITFDPGKTKNWKTSIEGMLRLCELGRILRQQGFRIYKRYFEDFPYRALNNVWMDLRGALDRIYAVQTATQVVERCLLMTTDPGDLVLDPTCGSGTTAYVAEQWGRRWITIDVSRVPLALARQRLLTATFPWYELADEPRGPAGGFVYRRKQNAKGEETGGIVPHVTLKSIANNEPPAEEVLVDRPETTSGITRVTGPFTFEATIPTPLEMASGGCQPPGCSPDATPSLTDRGVDTPRSPDLVDRMLEVLRRSPVLRLEGNKTVTLKNVRLPAKTLSLSAEAIISSAPLAPLGRGAGGEGSDNDQPVAFVFGPENGAVAEKLVFEAAREAHGKSYSHLYVIGFAIQPHARSLIDKSSDVIGIAATYVQATPDLLMGDLLKNMRSSQIFSVCGLPDVEVLKAKDGKYQVKLLGLDTFDPITMQSDPRRGDDVPAWLLDTDYNDLCFHVCQAFFPRTSAWDNLKKALKGTYEESVWDHLAGTTSAPFEAGDHGQIAVKVIDDRGNELLVVKKL